MKPKLDIGTGNISEIINYLKESKKASLISDIPTKEKLEFYVNHYNLLMINLMFCYLAIPKFGVVLKDIFLKLYSTENYYP